METYRLSYIPSSFDEQQIRGLFRAEDRELLQDPISIVASVSNPSTDQKVATVTFSGGPSFADKISNRDPQSFKRWGDIDPSCSTHAREICIDSSFEGLTPLNNVVLHQDTVDIVACTGLYGRAFGSWQHRQGTMWLRDVLPKDLSKCRVLIWGRHSQLHPGPSPSHADITHYRDALVEDLKLLRQKSMGKHRALILMGHSLGGILIKAAFVKICQDSIDSTLRDAIGGLVFIATPHEGIFNQPWIEIWGEEPSQQLIRDLGPGSALLRDLRQNFRKCLQEEPVLTLFELHESATVQKVGVIPDKKGPLALMIDEKAACINHPNEISMPFHGNHSNIAKLSCAYGCMYHNILPELKKIAASARVIVSHRTTKRYALYVLSDIKTYIFHLLRTSNSPLLMAESTELDYICSIFRDTKELWLGSANTTAGVANTLEAVDTLRALLRARISRAASMDESFKRELLGSFDDEFWGAREAEALSPEVDSAEIENIMIPSIIMLKQSLCVAIGNQDHSFLQTFLNSREAKHLGLDFVARNRSLLDKADIEPAQPLQGVLQKKEPKSGLTTAMWFPDDGNEGEVVFCEYRSYDADEPEECDRRKTASRELATILKGISSSTTSDDSSQIILRPTMSIFQFEGYCDDEDAKQLTFIYHIPKSMCLSVARLLEHSSTLEEWLRGSGRNPQLEEKFAIAYHICHSVFNQHLCGWVHKSIRPNNIVVLPIEPRVPKYMQVRPVYSYTPYLKGFEHSRAVTAISNRQSLLDPENDFYRHPNRRGSETFHVDFHPIHDIYAVGAVLVDIGLNKSLSRAVAETKKTSFLGIEDDITISIAKEKLPKLLGTRYAACAVKCLEGYKGLGLDRKERDDTKLAFAFRKEVVDELKRMAVSCGYLV